MDWWNAMLTWQYTQWIYGPRLDTLNWVANMSVNTAYNLR